MTDYDDWLSAFTLWLDQPHNSVRPFPPPDPCPLCHRHRWWLSIAHNWNCESCHPPDDERVVASRFEVKSRDA